jgi:hypothetical protein
MSYGGFSHGAAYERTVQALRERKPFRRSGYNMSAVEGCSSLHFFGELPREWSHIYKMDAGAGWGHDEGNYGEGIVYTVLSYETPIAWVTRAGLVRIPNVKYSTTTTQHQWTCRAHLTPHSSPDPNDVAEAARRARRALLARYSDSGGPFDVEGAQRMLVVESVTVDIVRPPWGMAGAVRVRTPDTANARQYSHGLISEIAERAAREAASHADIHTYDVNDVEVRWWGPRT